MIRKARKEDIDAVEKIYDAVHTDEELGKQTIGWIRNIYPVRQTAEEALHRQDLFVLEDNETICGAGIINNAQVDCYHSGNWKHTVPDHRVCVLHTLVIDPAHAGRGYGKAFIEFYEDYARNTECTELRIDTNAKNMVARKMYQKNGYQEIGIVPTEFNGIPGVNLVLLEKYLGEIGKTGENPGARQRLHCKT